MTKISIKQYAIIFIGNMKYFKWKLKVSIELHMFNDVKWPIKLRNLRPARTTGHNYMIKNEKEC